MATGGDVLITEADMCGGDMGEALCDVDSEEDLQIYEAGQGFNMIRKLAEAQGLPSPLNTPHPKLRLSGGVFDPERDKYVRILIGNGKQILRGGMESEFELRESPAEGRKEWGLNLAEMAGT